MEALFAAMGLIVVAAISGLVTWLVARRTSSGNIDTSEAAKLWDEGTVMRRELRDEVSSLKTQLTEALASITSLRSEVESSREEILRLISQINSMHSEIKTGNALTLGALADNAETRRILSIPKEERTASENEHVATASERIPEKYLPVIPESDRVVSNG